MTHECEFVEDCTDTVRTCGADADLVEVADVEVALCPRHIQKIPAGEPSDALTTYENDRGKKDTLGGFVDRDDTENVIITHADNLAFPDASAFPRREIRRIGRQRQEHRRVGVECDTLEHDRRSTSRSDQLVNSGGTRAGVLGRNVVEDRCRDLARVGVLKVKNGEVRGHPNIYREVQQDAPIIG
ncbi:hypothetical protein [Haladaptatus sp. T7]|uniref:hypothetical protein n=1 Tax=Haladaptatus sp. T7 TaxID=2029368 RepID=UPI0022314909|nr:hypothetical protein [Haladaptatus sp. T7]